MRTKLLIISILFLGFILGYIGIDWGLPNTWHGDELMGSVLAMGKNKDLNPHEFKTPSLQRYIVLSALAPYYLVIKNKSAFKGDDYASVPPWFIKQVYLIGRFVSLFMFMGAVLLTYFAAAFVYNKTVGLLAALFLSTTMIFVLYSHFVHVDAVVFWISLTLFFALLTLKKNSLKFYLLAAFSAGLATSTRYLFILILPVLLAGYIGLRQSGKRLGFFKITLMGLVLLLIGFIFGTPYSILSFKEWYSGVILQINEVRAFEVVFNNIGNLGIFANIRNMPEAVGWPYSILFISSFIYSWVLVAKKREYPLLIINLWIITWYFSYSFMSCSPVRHVIFISSSIAILNAKFAHDLISNNHIKRLFGLILITSAIVLSVIYSFCSDFLMINDSRYTASKWIERNISPADTVEEYGWHVKDVLNYHPPIPKNYNVNKIAYKDLSEHFKLLMREGPILPEWIIESSFHYQRYIGNPKFPTQSEFYAELFSGKLPYDLVAVFKSKINMPKFLIPKPEFVNPKILIFKRRGSLAIDE